MEKFSQTNKTSRIVGWILSAVVILFCLFDSFGKFAKPEAVVKGTMDLGYPESTITTIGVILLICIVLYAIPRTALLGAVLLTGYMGGAIATHVRIQTPLFSHILFPLYLGILFWWGLYLRSEKLRRLVKNKPLRS